MWPLSLWAVYETAPGALRPEALDAAALLPLQAAAAAYIEPETCHLAYY